MTPYTAGDIGPVGVTAVLRHLEWRETARQPGLYEVWASPDSLHELVIPLDDTKRDFADLLQRAIDSTLQQYGESARRLLSTFRMRSMAALEATKWRKETPIESGLIEWPHGEELYAAARAQLVASAKSTREARKYHGRAGSYIGRAFVDAALMGQTEIGSFVITAYTPSAKRFFFSESSAAQADGPQQQLAGDLATVSGAEILSTFQSALGAARAVLDAYRTAPRAELFLDAVPDGLSYEFTKALASMTTGGDATVEISRASQLTEAEHRPVVVHFEATEASVLEKAATVLAQDPEPLHVTITGEVTLLSRSHAGEGYRVIRLDVHEGAEINKARVRLSAEQYELAMDAHRSEADLTVSGRLEREGQYYWVYDASDVRPTTPREPRGYSLFDPTDAGDSE